MIIIKFITFRRISNCSGGLCTLAIDELDFLRGLWTFHEYHGIRCF